MRSLRDHSFVEISFSSLCCSRCSCAAVVLVVSAKSCPISTFFFTKFGCCRFDQALSSGKIKENLITLLALSVDSTLQRVIFNGRHLSSRSFRMVNLLKSKRFVRSVFFFLSEKPLAISRRLVAYAGTEVFDASHNPARIR